MTRVRDSTGEGEEPKADRAARAYAAYRDGKASKALALWEGLLERNDVDPEGELEIRFWVGTTLHGLGRYEEACRVVEPICFDPGALATSPPWVYRIATRAALIQIELARPLEQIEALLARIAELAPAASDPRRSRSWLVRGRLEMARGRRAAALRAFDRGLEGSCRASNPFADTPYFRAMLPVLLETRRLEDARHALECWDRSGDPDSFMLPHLPAFRADWLRARGETEAALRHAMFAFDRARHFEEIAGRLNAARSLCRAALLCGDVRRTRTGLHALLRERRRASPEERFRLDLTAVDIHLGLACLQAGLPVPDLEYGGEFAIETQGSRSRAGAAERALGDAARACVRAARSARAVDTVFGARFRTAASRRRDRFLRGLRRRISCMNAADAAARENGSRQNATWEPAVKTPSSAAAAVLAAKSTFAFASDGMKSWLITPADDLSALAEEFLESGRQIFVPYAADRDGRFHFDFWIDGELAGTGCASIATSVGDEGRWLVIETDDAPPPDWLARLAEQAKRYEGKRRFRRGEVALEAGETDLAANDFHVAVTLQPAWGSAWERSAHCLLVQGRAEDALEASLRALEIDSSGPQAWSTLARVFEAQGQPREAQASKQQARGRRKDDCDDDAGPGSKIPTEPTCMWTPGDSRCRKEASRAVRRS